MKSCELCEVPAKTFCESDQASLCWSCDAKVHGANFLVARHTRTLLCHACQSPTPWKASGERLGSTVSLCRRCAGGNKVEDGGGEESEGGNDDEVDTEDDDLDEDEDEEEDDDEVGDDEDGDNQVVPWSSTTAPPPAPSSSSSDASVSRCKHGEEDFSESVKTVLFKRRRTEDHDFQDGSNGWLSKRTNSAEWREKVGWLAGGGGESPSEVPLRPLSDGVTRLASAVDRYNGTRGCCEGRASEDV